LLSFAGHSGEIKFKIKDKQNLEKNIIATVNNFISSSEAQKNPISGLGIEVIFNSIPVIGGFTKDGPGIDSGLQKGDLILRINEKEISSTNDVSSIISQKPNELVNVEIRRGSESINYNILTTSINKNDGSEIGILGISFGSKRSVFGSITKAINETFNLSIKTIQFIGKMLTGSMGAENLSGPIGIAQMAGNTAQMGFMPFLYLMALLSISLGVLNLLPIPVLDGGQLTLLGIEALRGKPLPENIENMIYSTGGIIVLLLMVFVIFNDISRFL
jgi:regulator of sigma E protease